MTAGASRREYCCATDSHRGYLTKCGYGPAGRRFGRAVLSKEPHYRWCGLKGPVAAAEHLGHIVSLRERSDPRLVEDAVWPLCAACHNALDG